MCGALIPTVECVLCGICCPLPQVLRALHFDEKIDLAWGQKIDPLLEGEALAVLCCLVLCTAREQRALGARTNPNKGSR